MIRTVGPGRQSGARGSGQLVLKSRLRAEVAFLCGVLSLSFFSFFFLVVFQASPEQAGVPRGNDGPLLEKPDTAVGLAGHGGTRPQKRPFGTRGRPSGRKIDYGASRDSSPAA